MRYGADGCNSIWIVNNCYAVWYLVGHTYAGPVSNEISDDSAGDESLWQTVNLPVHLF